MAIDPCDQPLERRLVDAALRCVARWGVAKTTVEDVAREAGCSRATLYRAFPGGKDPLFETVVALEVGRLVSGVTAAIEQADDLEAAVVGAVTRAARLVAGHAALRFLLTHEPGLVLPHLAFRRLDELLARVRVEFGPPLARLLGDEAEAARAAEWVARIVLSYTCSPAAGVDLTDDASVRRLVRAFVLPGLAVPTA